MTVLEDRIRNVMANQVEAMHVPDATPDEQLARVVALPTARRRPRLLVATAAAGLLIATGFAISQRGTDGSVADSPFGAAGFRFETPVVLLEASSVEVKTALGQTFVPTPDVTVDGDPGMANPTLELTWHERGIEQRIFIYFTSDGTNWWANEIRTYDGRANAEWNTEQGEFFKSPLGTAYVGNVYLPFLTIQNMRLEAFRRPSACDNPTSPLALVANYPKINAPVADFGATLQVVDTTTCQPLAVSAFTFDYTSDDPAVARLQVPQTIIPDYDPTLTRVELELLAPGETTIHAVATDEAGNVVGSADMQIHVNPGGAPGTNDTAVPVPTSLP
jgi:hypothetical protein